jgi:hypothetical protein
VFAIDDIAPFTVTQEPPLSQSYGPCYVASIHDALPTLLPGNSPLKLDTAGAAASSGSANLLGQNDLQPLVQQAITLWSETGIAPAVLDSMKQATFVVADLSGLYLGVSYGKTVYLDRDAAGRGWFVDPTPGKDEEFGSGAAKSAASTRVDLLTVICHELAHIAGMSDVNDPDSLMNSRLQAGERRSPSPREVDALFGAGLFG